jgi:hypothetical protein
VTPDQRFDSAVVFVDDDGERVGLDHDEASALLALTSDLESATVSACPGCRSRVVAVVALVDVLAGSPHSRARDLAELAEDAPTLHLYVEDRVTDCTHAEWLDPGHEEWRDALDDEPTLGRPVP